MNLRRVTAVIVAASAALVLHLSCGGGPADDSPEPVAGPEAPHPLMAAVVEVEGWTRDGEPALYHGDELFELINGGADNRNGKNE